MPDDNQPITPKLFAKLAGKRGAHLTVFSDRRQMAAEAIESFAAPDVSRAVVFAPGRSLHDDEWYQVSLDEEQIAGMVQPYLDSALDTAGINTITAGDYEKVAALYKTDGTTLLVSKITPGLRVESKTLIGFNDHPELRQYEKAIEFTGKIDAYYDGQAHLYFRKYSTVSSLFSGIEMFYREATADEKQKFLSSSFLSVSGIDADAISLRDSSAMAAILDDRRINMDDSAFQQKVLAYAQEFVPELVAGDGKLAITDKATLRASLSLLTEKYYITRLFGDKREVLDSTTIEG